MPIHRQTDAVRLIVEQTWGDPAGEAAARLFAFDALADMPRHLPPPTTSVTWSSVVASANPADLLPPEAEVATETKRKVGGAA